MGYMNCSVTRGRGEMLATATGMNAEVGHIAGMRQRAEEEESPLTKQIDGLTLVVAALAGIALALIIVVGLGYRASFRDLYVMGIVLVIAGHRYSVTGQGYGSGGQIRHVGGAGEANLDPNLLPMVLCSEPVVQDGELVGDPTERAHWSCWPKTAASWSMPHASNSRASPRSRSTGPTS